MSMKFMIKEFLKHIKLLGIGLVLVMGISYVSAYASTWVPMPENPPASNAEFPVHVGVDAQEKTGALSVNAFLASLASQFEQKLYLQGVVLGASQNNNGISPYIVSFGAQEPGHSYITDIALTGNLKAKNSLVSRKLITDRPHGTTLLAILPVCADTTGTLYLCDADNSSSTDVCANIDGIQTSVPEGMHISTEVPGNCDQNTIPPENPPVEQCQYFVTAEPQYDSSGNPVFRKINITLWNGNAVATGTSQAPHYSGSIYNGSFDSIKLSAHNFATENCIEFDAQSNQQMLCESPQVWGENWFTLTLASNPGMYETGVWGTNGMKFIAPVVVRKTSGATPQTITVPVECTSGFYK